MDTDVLIAGGGPNGLMLASELALNGVRPIVLESRTEPDPVVRANGLVGRIVPLLDRRGLLARCGGPDGPPEPVPYFMFGAIPLDVHDLPDNPLTLLPIPQPRLTAVLAERARELDVEIRPGHRLTGLDDRGDAVTAEVNGPDGPYRIAARYLVGADGARSLVRKTLGIGFPGNTNPDDVDRVADVAIPEEYLDPETGGLRLPGGVRVPLGMHRTATGLFSTARFTEGMQLVGTHEWGTPPPTEGTPMTLDELRASVRRVLGTDLPISAPPGPGPHRLYRIVPQTRQAETYRRGRVLLVGDAAHIHLGIGGPGLNLGLQDSVNLGWKLAATVHGWAPDGLLDTYESERHPVGARVLMHTKAQASLLPPGAEVDGMRELFAELLRDHPDVRAHIAAMMTGADVRYPTRPGPLQSGTIPGPGDDAVEAARGVGFIPSGTASGPAGRVAAATRGGTDDGVPDGAARTHPSAGRWANDLPVRTAEGATRLAVLQRTGRPLLLDLAGRAEATEVAAGWADRVEVVRAEPDGVPAPADALLIRPDGYAAWAAAPGDPPDAVRDDLRMALTTWFGAPVAAPIDAR